MPPRLDDRVRLDDSFDVSPRRITPRVKRALLVVMLVAVVVFAWLALHDTWSDVKDSLRTLRVADLVIATTAGLVSSWALFRAWRTILHGLHVETLSGHDSRTMFFCSQLGKYVPGSVWPAVIQTEIGTRSNVPRSVVLSSYAFALVAGVGVGGVFATGTLAHPVPGWVQLGAVGALVGGVLLCVAFVHPSGSQRLWRRLLGSRVPPGGLPDLDLPTTARAIAWTALGWASLGVHAWILARPFGASASDIVFVTGSFALAWIAGIAALPLPAGAGLREAVLVVTLGKLIGQPAAISVALMSRLLMIVNDVGLSLIAGLPRVLREIKGHRAAASPTE
jgi:uncharacterized membrane protein YbhN (UPF0104 family)